MMWGFEMVTMEEYRKNPCGVLSIPFWKNKFVRIPEAMQIVHDSAYTRSGYEDYDDVPYFRLYHPLGDIAPFTLAGFRIATANWEDIPVFVDVINRSYTDLSVTYEQLLAYTHTDVYQSRLWIMAIEEATSAVVGCAIADLDQQLHEGIIEWVQVAPGYRRKGIGQLLVNEMLIRLKDDADFATVSGKIDSESSPEFLYRRCGFVGNDVWHILTKQEI